MSKFIDKLKRASNKTVVPLGFKKPSAEEETPPILLIANLSGDTLKQAKELVDAGVDTVLLDLGDAEAAELAKYQKAIGDLPFGFELSESFSGDIDKLIEKGCDFIIFDINATVDQIDREKLGRALVIDKSLTPGMVKAIGDLEMDIDCIVIDGAKRGADLQILLAAHLYKDILNKPILMRVQRSPSKSELVELNAAGIRGLILATKITAASIRELQQLIRGLPKSVKKKTNDRPLIPSISLGAPHEKEEVQHEEEEEDEDI